MKQSTREWIKKAEADYETALTLARKRKVPLHDQVCFHCQQCAEKYLKARLEEAGRRIPRIHDLGALLNDVLPVEPLWSAMRPALEFLSDYAVDFRYPGNEADAPAAKDAVRFTKAFRAEARAALGLKT